MQGSEAWKYLGDYKVVEALLAIFTIVACAAAIFRGSWDKKTSGPSTNGTPNWLLYGPAHDTMEVIQNIAEYNRERNRILERIEEMMKATGKMQWEACNALKRIEELNAARNRDSREQTMLLEDLRNNQVLRGDATLGIPRRK